MKKILFEWEGVVEEIKNEYFEAKLLAITENRNTEFCTFKINDVDKLDRKLIKPGAIFNWCIFNDKTDTIIFKKSVPFTKKEIKEIENRANKRILALKDLIQDD